jgi:hypothetical protein
MLYILPSFISLLFNLCLIDFSDDKLSVELSDKGADKGENSGGLDIIDICDHGHQIPSHR